MTATLSNTQATASDHFLQPLMEYVIAATGLMYYADRRREFSTHVASRLEALAIGSCQKYLQFLQGGPHGNAELDRLITLLTIGETHFFRHRELFRALENTVLPNLIEKNKCQRRLRIWSAGCSIGAEAYSISMLLRRRFAHSLADWDIRIIGTDINRDFLARASTGRFEDWALRAVSAEERNACFLQDGKRWSVKPQYQQGVSFEYHNLASQQFSSPLEGGASFDLILCRNVMIYFARATVRQAIDNLHACLAAEGWLIVGHAEHNIDWFRSFRTQISDGAILYQKPTLSLANAEVTAEPRTAAFAFTAADAPFPSAALAEPAAEPVVEPASSPFPIRQDVRDDCKLRAAREKQNALQGIRSLADRGELEEALARCQSLQRSDSSDPSLHFYQALILQQINDDAGAQKAPRRTIYLDRNCTLAHYSLGLLLQKQGDVLRASRSFQNVLKLLMRKPPHEPIPNAEELTVADLTTLSTAHLKAMEQR